MSKIIFMGLWKMPFLCIINSNSCIFLQKNNCGYAFMFKFTGILSMPERNWTCSYLVRRLFNRNILFLLSLLVVFSVKAQTTDELKKKADKLFKEENYDEAYKYYSQLVSNFPKDPEYNYRLGVCMVYSEPDKTKCLPFLKTAAANPAEAPKEVYFYIGKAYHINYRFDDAIKNYNEFKKTAPPTLQKKLQVDREIQSCNNGKRLLSNVTDLVVLNKKELPKVDYFRSYELKKMGKLLVKPDEFKTALDKKKKESSVVFLPSKSDVVYFSSYGEDSETGKDIYTSTRVNGVFSKPVKVQNINTEFDEDFPFLHPDGKTLYFASKGFNSMGGYDIFRSTFNESTQTWNTPVNMEFPVNSPDDDYLYVTDSLETLAFFSTGRQSPPGKIDVLKVKTKRRAIDMLAVKGQVKAGQVDHSLASVITVKSAGGAQEFGTFTASEEGSYTLELPNAMKVTLTVATPGMETQTADVNIPPTESLKPMRQTITYENGKLVIENSFDDTAGDDSYLDYLNVIEKKARLNVNASETTEDSKPLAAETKGTTPASPPPPAARSNKELAAIAQKDAEESKEEAALLRSESKNALEAGDRLNSEAKRKKLEADSFRDSDVAKADSLSKSSDLDADLSTRILALGNVLAEDAARKEKEASLNEQYASELALAITSKDPKALQKLSDLQQEIEVLAKQENASSERLASLKAEIAETEAALTRLDDEKQEVSSDISEINNLIASKENELQGTKKKKEKERLGEEIANLKLERTEKENTLTEIADKSVRFQDEIGAGKKELDIASTLKEKAVAEPPKPVMKDMTAKQLRDYYGPKIVVVDNNDRASIQNSNAALNNYNTDIESAIVRNKKALAQASATEKQPITQELKTLDAEKKLNQTRLAANENRIKELAKIEEQEKVIVEANSTYRPIKADNPLEALSLINEIASDLQETETELFSINYKSPEALRLRDAAASELNASGEKQNQVLSDLKVAKEQLQKVDVNAPTEIILADSMLLQADRISQQAQALRDKAASSGSPEKENLIAEARKLEDQAADKNLAASEITSQDNTIIIATNKENIQNLIKLNGATEQDVATARRLNDEAVAAFRKAVEIRTEARSLKNKGSKLGSYSNAEDLEAEAVLKQQEAIDLLMRSNPDFTPKVAVTSVVKAKTENSKPKGPTLAEALSTVNTSLVELGTVKLQSYQKLYAANAAEIEALTADVQAKEAIALKSPSLKTELLKTRKLVAYAVQYKTNSDAATETNEQFNLLLTAIKQQNLAQQKLAELKFAIEKAENQSKSAPVVTEVVAVTTTGEPDPEPATPEKKEIKPEPISAKSPSPNPTVKAPVPAKKPAPAVKKPATQTVATPKKVQKPATKQTNPIIELAEVTKSDTTSAQVVGLISSRNQTLKNEEAGEMLKTSLDRLKAIDLELAVTNELVRKNEEIRRNAEASAAEPEDMRKTADVLLDESEKLAEEAADARNSAANSTGSQREAFITAAKELEKESQTKMFGSIRQMQMANEKEVRVNNRAMTDLIALLEQDDASAASAMKIRRDSLEFLKSQIKTLRLEADNQSSAAAKLGAAGNAEEKEQELIKKQTILLTELRGRYPDYSMTPLEADLEGLDTTAESKKATLIDEQYTQLINLSNGFSLEYETAKLSVPETLTGTDLDIKKNADELNAESKRLLIASALETDYNRRMRLLALAAKYGNYAVEQLSKIGQVGGGNNLAGTNKNGGLDLSKVQLVDASQPTTTSSTETGSPTQARNDAKAGKPAPAVAKGKTIPAANASGITIVRGNAYTNANPIPIDAVMENGLIFRVQIGAFKTAIPNNAFKGLTPLNGETTKNGYIRYTAGNFQKIEGANAVKNDLRGLGYADAFVVAYLDGKRISLAEAMATLNEKGISIDPSAPQTAGITANENIPRASQSADIIQPAKVAKELEKSKALLYTIQIGVYNKPATIAQLRGLSPICAEQLSSGLFRYTAGIYNSPERVIGDKQKVVELGFRDAFVSAYRDGKRITFAEARTQQQNDPGVPTENESPIQIGTSSSQFITVTPSPALSTNIIPYSNSVTAYPPADEENGIKTDEKGISFKVQIGAFSKEVPEDMVNLFNLIKNWPVEYKIINGLYVYTTGNFISAKSATVLREEIKALGLQDAYITVYRDGNKLSGPESEELLKQ